MHFLNQSTHQPSSLSWNFINRKWIKNFSKIDFQRGLLTPTTDLDLWRDEAFATQKEMLFKLQTDLTLGIVLTVRSDWSWSLEFRVEQHMENWLFTHEVSSITEVVIEFLISFRWLLWTIAIDHLQSHENIKLLFVLRRKTILCDGVLKTIILRGWW